MLFAVLLAVAASTLARAQSFDPNKAGPQSWDPAAVGTNTTVLTSPLSLSPAWLTHRPLQQTNATYSNPIFTANVGDPYSRLSPSLLPPARVLTLLTRVSK